jgi:hypothetical protein
MELKRRFGIVIVSGIPAIVGSGLMWALSKSWALVFAYLLLLAIVLMAFLFVPERFVSSFHIWNPVSDRIKGLGSRFRDSFGV